MADLTTLEEKLAECTGLAGAAQETTKKVEGLLESGAGYLADGDTVTLRGRAGSVELGAVRGTIVGDR